MDGAVSLSSGQLIAATVYLVGQTVALLGVIRHLYQQQVATCERANTAAEARHKDEKAALERRIERLEQRQEERDRGDERYVQTLEEAVAVMRRQAEATAVIAQAPPARRGRAGDD